MKSVGVVVIMKAMKVNSVWLLKYYCSQWWHTVYFKLIAAEDLMYCFDV